MQQDDSHVEKMDENVEVNKTENSNKKRITPKAVGKEVLNWVITFVVVFALVIVLNRVVFINAVIPSGSMENTIMTGDRLLGVRLAYLFDEPERGDIIIFKFPDNETETYIKRIIGMPGDVVEIRDAGIYLNGSPTPLEEDYLKEEWISKTGPYYFEVPENSYLVLGDNRNTSIDAREWNNSYVAKDKILGKAWFRYYPFDAMGVVE